MKIGFYKEKNELIKEIIKYFREPRVVNILYKLTKEEISFLKFVIESEIDSVNYIDNLFYEITEKGEQKK